ncbi:uncharacterized protein LOC110620928 [Manihot esculenta]|uniref:PHD-type domain-containing protein n=1 Tax=Manihot esculenta TaxID=3983 RepID=A0A251KCQ7_MANES|nr:uncharacterized protein LOC110620928 [Manihot esculenta]OAY43987.1 hypothetical protein MANES_08G113700v8 [Manihot esculenta]OAY43988.1 hypothetical protein MANES_08G113700v8 [Manihot esculenta]
MGRGGRVNYKRNFKSRVRSKDKDSDDSDEDYVVEAEENPTDGDSYNSGNCLDDYSSEESFDSFIEEEEEEEEFRNVVRSKNIKGSQPNGNIGGKTSQKRKRVSYEEEGDEDYVHEGDDDDEDDDEFTLDDDDFLDEDEELTAKKKRNNMRVGKRRTEKRGSRRGPKKQRKSRVSKKPSVQKGRKNRRLRKKERCKYDDEYDVDFIDDSAIIREKSSENSNVRRRRRYVMYSDSDFMPSGSSDYEFTISEDEREQVREASKLYGELKTSLRSSSSIKKIQQIGDLCEQGKSIVRKGKEKVKEVRAEVGKQVCGICLSEEDKRRLRGILNCCDHYFCFTCIMEWSKVESRCPLCKQRFKTITKDGRTAVGVDLRNMVVEVPKRDQVYQPSEEEIRNFIDPYENVICTECHEGGDDGLMLLCDLCDSPAHTYCVGLGRQVPEGNWYCDGCRPVALGSSSFQTQELLPDQRTTSNTFNRSSLVSNNGDDLDPTLDSSPCLAFAQVVGNLSSPRFSSGDVQAASPVSGAGAPTLSMRRHIHRRIQNILSISRMYNMGSRAGDVSAANLYSDPSMPQIDQCRENAIQSSRTQEMGSLQSASFDVRLHDHPSSSLQNGDLFAISSIQLRTQAVHDPTITTIDRSVNLTLWPELTGINSASCHDQSNQGNSRPGIVSEVNLVPHKAREESQFYVVKEQLQSMVKSHLGSLSQGIDLGHDTFKEITRSSTHTILAGCGLEHKRSEVQFMPLPSICTHVERVAAGQTSIMKGLCLSCFDSFVRDVVKRIMDTRLPQWLSLGL